MTDFFDKSCIPSGDFAPDSQALSRAQEIVKMLQQSDISPKEVNFDEGVQLVYPSNGYNLLVHVGAEYIMLFKSNVDPDEYGEEFPLSLWEYVCVEVRYIISGK
jgi:hypothetical protein